MRCRASDRVRSAHAVDQTSAAGFLPRRGPVRLLVRRSRVVLTFRNLHRPASESRPYNFLASDILPRADSRRGGLAEIGPYNFVAPCIGRLRCTAGRWKAGPARRHGRKGEELAERAICETRERRRLDFERRVMLARSVAVALPYPRRRCPRTAKSPDARVRPPRRLPNSNCACCTTRFRLKETARR